jgi:hypothetical protein
VTATEVAISLKLLLQARFAAEGTELSGVLDDVLSKEAERTDNAPNSDAISRLRKIAMDGSVGDVLPFRLDSLDLNIASVLLREISTQGHEGIVFGIGSLVNAGFAVVRDNKIEYVDSWVEASRTASSRIATRLIPSNRQRFRAEVQGLGNFQPVAMTADGAEPAILLQAANLAAAAKAIKQGYQFICRVLDPFTDSSKRSALSGIRVSFSADQNALRLTPTKPETLIQLGAAHQQKRWMELSSGDFRSLFAIPDISEEGDSSPAWVLGFVGDESYVFSRCSTEIHVDIEVALKCCEAFRWFVIPDNWEIARRLSTMPLEKLGLPI